MKYLGEPVDLLKIVRGSHRPSNHHQPPQHLPRSQSILKFSSFLYFPYKFMQHGFLQDFHLEKFSLHGRQDGQGPGVHFTRITAGLSVTQPLNKTSSGSNDIRSLWRFSQSLHLTSPHLL